MFLFTVRPLVDDRLCVHTFAVQCADVFMCSKVFVMSISLMNRGLRCKRVFVHQSMLFHELSD